MKLSLFRHRPRSPRRERERYERYGAARRRYIRYALIGAAALFLLVLIARSFRTEPGVMSSAEVQTIAERGILRAGLCTGMPGMSLDGEGLEVQLAELLARRMLPDIPEGNSLRIVEVNAANVDAKMADGQIDVAIAMMPLGARESQYAYSRPYYEDPCYFVTAAHSTRLNLQDVTVGYVRGMPEAAVLESYSEARPASNIEAVAYASYPDMLDALMRSKLDAAIMTQLYIGRYEEETALNPLSNIPYKLYQLRTSSLSPGSVQYALACPLDTPALATLMSLLLEDMEADGSLEGLYAKYGLEVVKKAEEE